MSISSIGNSYMMECLFRSKAALKAEETSFANKMREALPPQTETYLAQLEAKYGPIAVKSVGNDQKSLDRLGASTYGTGNVVIAPNILEQMASDPKKAAYYESKIQGYFDSLPRLEAEMSMAGFEIHSRGIVIHPDGTVTHYVSGDLKPEVRARIEAQIEKEQEEKAARRRASMERSQEAAEARRVYIDLRQEAAYQREQAMDALLSYGLRNMDGFAGQAMQGLTPGLIAAAYEKNIMGW